MLRAPEIALAITAAFTLGLLPTPSAAERKKDKEGSANDQNGNLSWRSSATESDRQWIYARYATNKDPARKCKIRWICGSQKIQTTLPAAPMKGKPEETELCSLSHEDLPKEVAGELYYNGGQAAGEGHNKEASIWYPTKLSASTNVKSRALLGFEKGDKFSEVAVVATSTRDGAKFQYSLTIKSTARSAVVPLGFRVKWTATESPNVRKAIEELKVATYNPKDNVFFIDKTVVDGQMVSFEFQTKEDLEVRDTEVLILDPAAKEKDAILARAPLPAYAPKERTAPPK